MKKNLLFFLFLILLLTGTYYFEERGERLRQEKVERDNQVVSFLSPEKWQDLQEIRLVPQNTRLVKKENQFYTSYDKVPVDGKILSEFLDNLSALSIERLIAADEKRHLARKTFFPEPVMSLHFIFKQGEIIYRLGKKLEMSESFYMEIERDGQIQWAVVNDKRPRFEIYSKNEFNSPEKYQRLQALLTSQEVYFQQKKTLSQRNSLQNGEEITDQTQHRASSPQRN